jgi:NADH-quinone oxidoreductase subunit N
MMTVEGLVYSILAISVITPLVAMATSRTSKILPSLTWLAIIIYAITGLYIYDNSPVKLYNGLIVEDKFSALLIMAISLTASIALLASGVEPAYWESSPAYYSLLPLALFGTFYLVGAQDALVVLAAWLLVSVISYVLLALPSEKKSRAAAVQYIFIGALATLFLGVWVASDYVVSSQLGRLGFSLTSLTPDHLSGLVLISFLAAIGFKTGVVPFHWWLPSVYSKGNGYMVGVVSGPIKIAFLGLLAKVILAASGSQLVSGEIALILAVLAVLTMTYGNIAALTTRDLQKLLAYSSIAQVGYILVGLAALAYLAPKGTNPYLTLAIAGVAIQATAYGIAKSALFHVNVDESSLDKLRGLLSGNKVAAASAAILLLSLLGMPPFLGFCGKLYLFYSATRYSLVLVAIALINSAISSAYYVRALRDLVSPGGQLKPRHSIVVAITIAAVVILVLGLIGPLYVAALS